MFIDYGQAFTPDRERQEEIVAELIAAVAPVRLVVELCSGGGDLARLLLDRLPEIRLRALDGSPRMLAAARATCAAYADRLDLQAFDLAAPDWRALQPAPDAICSSLAIHHLDGTAKRQLFEDLFAALRPGGLFVLADLVRPASEAGWQISAEDWDRVVAARSLRALRRRSGGAQVRGAALELLPLAGRQRHRSPVHSRRARPLAERCRLRGDRPALAAGRPRHPVRPQALTSRSDRARRRRRRWPETFQTQPPPPPMRAVSATSRPWSPIWR